MLMKDGSIVSLDAAKFDNFNRLALGATDGKSKVNTNQSKI